MLPIYTWCNISKKKNISCEFHLRVKCFIPKNSEKWGFVIFIIVEGTLMWCLFLVNHISGLVWFLIFLLLYSGDLQVLFTLTDANTIHIKKTLLHPLTINQILLESLLLLQIPLLKTLNCITKSNLFPSVLTLLATLNPP